MISPERVTVLSVGIERYGAGIPDVPGAAAAAERFARWARACGVPAERIRLACSRVEPVSAQAPEGVVALEATSGALQPAIVDVGAQDADLLLLFWCGHGLMDERRQRVVFTADAVEGNLRHLRVTDMVELFASTAAPYLGEQVLLIDACATFSATAHLNSAPARIGLPIGDPVDKRQFALFAAAQGQRAAANATARSTAFSAPTLEWLETQPGVGFQVGALTAHVKGHFQRLREEGVTLQRPVHLLVEHDGDVDYLPYGGTPVSGAVQDAARTANFSVRQLERITEEVRSVPFLASDEVRRRLVDELDPDAVIGPVTWSDLDAVVQHAATTEGGRARFIDALLAFAVDEVQRLGVYAVDTCWRRQERIAPAVMKLPSVVRQPLRAALDHALDGQRHPVPGDVDDAFEIAASFGVERAQRLAAELEHVTGERVPDAWYDLPDEALQRLRAVPAERVPRVPHLVVDLRGGDPAARDWPAEVYGHLQVAGGDWARESVPADQGIERAVGALIAKVHERAIPGFTVGLMVPRHALDEHPEAWACPSGDPLYGDEVLGQAYPTVLHSAERFGSVRAHTAWRGRVDRIADAVLYDGADLEWVEGADAQLIRMAVRDRVAACVGLRFTPGSAARMPAQDPILAAISGGAPYLLWCARDPENWEATKDRLRALVRQGAFSRLPARLHELHGEDTELGGLVRLIWDDPDLLPPDAVFTGLGVT